jgi:hypothetical protein
MTAGVTAEPTVAVLKTIVTAASLFKIGVGLLIFSSLARHSTGVWLWFDDLLFTKGSYRSSRCPVEQGGEIRQSRVWGSRIQTSGKISYNSNR